jgi:hypothetical protein
MAAHWNGGSGGKGSAPRPLSVSDIEYAQRWDVIFGKDVKDDSEDDKISRSNEETQEAKRMTKND